MLPRSLELREIYKPTDDHIFEETLKIELSPIPQAYTLKFWGSSNFLCNFNALWNLIDSRALFQRVSSPKGH